MKTEILDRLHALRARMTAHNIDAVIIPHADPHQSEYMADHWHLREFFSGFSGSAGTLVVTNADARLWTDSRYFLQAADQLDGTGITLMKDGLPDTPSISEWLVATLPQGATVAIDGMLQSVNSAASLTATLSKANLWLITDFHPADRIWTSRPPLPADHAFIHPAEYAGENASDKLKRVFDDITANNAEGRIICALDEIAWLLNLRGSDVTYNPVVTSFLYLSPAGSVLFIDDVKLTDDVRAHLSAIGVTTRPYSEVLDFISSLPASIHVLADPATTSAAFVTPLGDRFVSAPSPIPLMKAIRNSVQIEGVREAMIRDGVALTGAMMEIEQRLRECDNTLTEMEVARILTRHRSRQPLYFDDSFATIAGFREHGAIVHYEADETSDVLLEPSGLLLIDSGAQYLDGTTDITRTVSLGDPTPDEIHDFTLVLMGHIDLAAATFPEGTRGAQLDVLARRYLWAEGKTYLHGTGHGVGHFLNVHEGPQSIRLQENPVQLRPGMLTSDEPGLYLAGRYGIRIENLVLTAEAFSTPDNGTFLCFDTVTLFPYDRKLIDPSMMTEAQLSWLNDYHARVYATLAPRLDDEGARSWLAEATAPVYR